MGSASLNPSYGITTAYTGSRVSMMRANMLAPIGKILSSS
jgi:hypothetical protein